MVVGMDWWRLEWPFSRVRKKISRGRNFQENLRNSAEIQILAKFWGSEQMKIQSSKQVHTPSQTPTSLTEDRMRCKMASWTWWTWRIKGTTLCGNTVIVETPPQETPHHVLRALKSARPCPSDPWSVGKHYSQTKTPSLVKKNLKEHCREVANFKHNFRC